MESAIITDMSMTDYLSHPAIGSSQLKVILSSPADFLAYLENGGEETKASRLGTAAHMIILEKEKFHNTYALQPEDWGPKNAGIGYKKWAEFKKENDGKICIDFEEAKLLSRIVKSVDNHRGLKSIFNAGKPEVTSIVEHGPCKLKARVDWITDDGMIWDIKTTSKDISDAELEKTIFNYGYHFQAAFHSLVFKKCTPIKGFGWIFVSTSTPAVHIVTRKASEKVLSAGLFDVEYALGVYEKCLEANNWHGYDDEIKEINLPDFAMKNYESTELVVI